MSLHETLKIKLFNITALFFVVVLEYLTPSNKPCNRRKFARIFVRIQDEKKAVETDNDINQVV